jgi:hypothetical protein
MVSDLLNGPEETQREMVQIVGVDLPVAGYRVAHVTVSLFVQCCVAMANVGFEQTATPFVGHRALLLSGRNLV